MIRAFTLHLAKLAGFTALVQNMIWGTLWDLGGNCRSVSLANYCIKIFFNLFSNFALMESANQSVWLLNLIFFTF